MSRRTVSVDRGTPSGPGGGPPEPTHSSVSNRTPAALADAVPTDDARTTASSCRTAAAADASARLASAAAAAADVAASAAAVSLAAAAASGVADDDACAKAARSSSAWAVSCLTLPTPPARGGTVRDVLVRSNDTPQPRRRLTLLTRPLSWGR